MYRVRGFSRFLFCVGVLVAFTGIGLGFVRLGDSRSLGFLFRLLEENCTIFSESSSVGLLGRDVVNCRITWFGLGVFVLVSSCIEWVLDLDVRLCLKG